MPDTKTTGPSRRFRLGPNFSRSIALGTAKSDRTMDHFA
jgi:hypothetical protein